MLLSLMPLLCRLFHYAEAAVAARCAATHAFEIRIAAATTCHYAALTLYADAAF